ncbi:hypothetical protein [Acetobacter sp. DsW_063]|uniref:hypothetical protein n=1 Tax=Acetobacter sp. DsW_063 TaxID=1514894 RepID=UPI000A390A02|nr:hypothetical protein [Acetobacter sp. DsW_063]OUJ12673.1 hypothetical protein HK28_03130 [Acetobacter sp. DsW_063]
MPDELVSRVEALEKKVSEIQEKMGEASPERNARNLNLISKIVASISVNIRELWKAVKIKRH